MRLNQNPFYILNVSYKANRRAIANAVDDMGLLLDATICANAQKELTTPSRRINAEIRWFLTDDPTKLNRIRTAISNNAEIPTDDYDSFSELNAAVHNYEISDETDPIEIGYGIFNISEIFESLIPEQIMDVINAGRRESGFADADINEVKSALANRRDDIVQAITSKLETISDVEYIDLINMVSERASEIGSFGTVLSNVINQYELRVQPQVEKISQCIKAEIESIEATDENDSIEKSVRILIEDVKKWDRYAQPVQLLSHASGMPHQNSEEMGSALRNLAVFLHNEKGKSKEALAIVNEMKSVFAELDGLLEVFESDSDTLEKLIKEDEKTQEIVKVMEKLENLGNGVKRFPSESMVTNYISTIKEADSKIKSSNIDYSTRQNLRENVAYSARGVAVDIHNNNHDTANALKIVNALIEEFSDIYEIASKLRQDKNVLDQELIKSITAGIRGTNYSRRSASNTIGDDDFSLLKGILVVIFAIIILVAIIDSCSSHSSSSSSSNTSVQTMDAAKVESSSATNKSSNNSNTGKSTSKENNTVKAPYNSVNGSKAELKQKIDNVEREINSLQASLDTLKVKITSQESELMSMQMELNSYEAQYNSTGNDTYRIQYNSLLGTYQSKCNAYDSNIDSYNSKVDQYESKVDEYNRLVDQYNAM